jgi:16S rRNA (cytosine967-C5)-methyltransferase
MTLADRPRVLALAVLTEVLRRRRPFDEALEAGLDPSGLEGRDRAFVRLLAATALRRLGQLDAVIAAMLDRPGSLRPEVQDLLRLGAAQALGLGTPGHAAVDTTVTLAAASTVTAPYKPLINAVMRRLCRDGPAMLAGQDAPRLNTPDWLWQSWQAAYGPERTRAIAEAHLGEAPLDLSLKLPAEAGRWAERLDARVLPTGGSLRRAAGGTIPELPGFGEGAWWVQDAAAALPATLLGPLAGRRVFDLAAAPGGKTAQLAAAGARVVAVDRAAGRLARLHANLARLGLSAETVTADIARWVPEEPADAVLLDAPCSATGTIRRHPDIPLLKGPDDVARLVVVQTRLLAHAVTLVRPGGVLVYTVCSLQPEEGEERLAALLGSGAPVEPLPIAAHEVGGLEELVTSAGTVRTLPCHLAGQGGLDGFFIGRVRRT